MMNPSSAEPLDALRNRLLNRMLLGVAVVALPAVAISLWRIATLGWKPVMGLHLALAAALWLLWLKRCTIPYFVRAIGLLVTFWLIGVAGYLQLGPAAAGGTFLLMFAFSGMLLFSQRTGWWLVLIVALSVIGIGVAATRHWLAFAVDYPRYAYHAASWLNIAWSLSSFSVVLAYAAWNMVHGMRQHDEAARALAARMQKIGANVPGVIYQYLLRPDGSSCFPYASDGIRDIYGVAPGAVQTDASAAFGALHPSDVEAVVKSIRDSARDLHEWHALYRVNHPWKGEIWVEGRATPERLTNGDVIWHGVIVDITERKKAEQVKEAFVATVSHELRTPLTSIRGSLGLLAGGVAGELPDRAKSLVDIALNNGERLGNLINDLLDIETAASGNIALRLQPLALMPLVELSLAANQGYADVHGIGMALTQRLDGAIVAVDAQRLQQALANFLSNAVKFSPPGGQVEVAVVARDQAVRIMVTDHGTGIPDAFRRQVFEKFSQADTSTTRSKGGTGLGLAITKEIVERMLGRVGFDSVAGEHTTFWLELPLAEPKTTDEPAR